MIWKHKNFPFVYSSLKKPMKLANIYTKSQDSKHDSKYGQKFTFFKAGSAKVTN